MPKRQRSLHISLAARRAARAQARQALPEPVAQADPCCTDPSGTHHLAQELLDRWAWGTFSAKAVQQLAHGAYKDGSTSSAIAHLAKLGSWGRNPQNCQRELQQLLHSQLHRMPEPCMIKVPLASDKNRAGVLVVEQPYLPLHRVFAHVHQNFPEQFAQMFGTGQLQAFWAEVSAQDPNFVQWAQKLEYKNMARCVPFALHGDGVPVFKHKSLEVLSANALLGTGSSKQVKVLLFVYWAHLRAKTPWTRRRPLPAQQHVDTEESLWVAVRWDLEALFSGVHPGTDWCGRPWPVHSTEAQAAGSPLAGHFWGLPWVLKGDLEHLSKVLGLESTNANSPCVWCRANRSSMPWTDFSQGAQWKQTLWERAAWKEAHPHVHPVFRVLELSIHSVHVDILHTISLGVAQHCTGNALYLLCFHVLRGSRAQALQTVWDMVQDFYSSHHVTTRIRKLCYSMFLPEQRSPHAHYPCLTTKAKETEYLSLAVHWIWEQFRDVHSAHDDSVSVVMHSLVTIFELCRCPSGRLFLEPVQIQELRACTDTLLLHYTALGNHAAQQGQFRWNVVPKFHMAWHLAWQSQYLHPHASACFLDESFVGVVKKVAQACTAGRKIALVGSLVLSKYMFGLALAWTQKHPAGSSLWN